MSEPVIPERWKSDYEHSKTCRLQGCAESRFEASCEELGAAEAKVAELERQIAEIKRLEPMPMAARAIFAEATVTLQAATIERLTGYKTAFDTAREQILYMVGPLEINEILTTMDEACEQAALEQSRSPK